MGVIAAVFILSGIDIDDVAVCVTNPEGTVAGRRDKLLSSRHRVITLLVFNVNGDLKSTAPTRRVTVTPNTGAVALAAGGVAPAEAGGVVPAGAGGAGSTFVYMAEMPLLVS